MEDDMALQARLHANLMTTLSNQASERLIDHLMHQNLEEMRTLNLSTTSDMLEEAGRMATIAMHAVEFAAEQAVHMHTDELV